MAPEDTREDREPIDREEFEAYEREQAKPHPLPVVAASNAAFLAGLALAVAGGLPGCAIPWRPPTPFEVKQEQERLQTEDEKKAALDRAQSKRDRRNARNLKNKANGG